MTLPEGYQIHRVTFECSGCQAKWDATIDPPLTSATEIVKFLKSNPTGCPNNCGSRSADVKFKLEPVNN